MWICRFLCFTFKIVRYFRKKCVNIDILSKFIVCLGGKRIFRRNVCMSMAYEEYMKQMVKPMREELVQSGFKELVSVEDVEEYMERCRRNNTCGC